MIHDEQWMEDLAHLKNDLAYGFLGSTIQQHKDQVTKLEVTRTRSIKNQDWDNQNYGAACIRILNDAIDQKMTGALSYTVNLKNGEITQVLHTEHRDINYPLR